MDRLEKEKLFLQVSGPELLGLRYIYTPQETQFGIQFGAYRCKIPANKIKIEKLDDSYSIIYIKYTKPNFKKGVSSKSRVVKQIENLSIEELKIVLRSSFKYME